MTEFSEFTMVYRKCAKLFILALVLPLPGCLGLFPTFEATPSGAVDGYRCPPLVEYQDNEPARAAEQVEPGSAADILISDYSLMRKLCR